VQFTGTVAARDDLVRAHWRELLPTAYLLTGDQATARQLVVRTLARRRPLVTDRETALRALVRTHRSRWQLTGRADIEGDAAVPWWSSPESTVAAHELADGLDLLDRDDRTAVVLRWFEDLPADQVTALVPGARPDEAAHRLPVDEAELSRRLDDLAARCDLGTLDDDAVTAAVRETTTSRTRRAVLAAGAVAVLAGVGVSVPAALPGAGSQTARPTAATTATAPLQGIFALPARGALADDDDLLVALRQHLTALGVPGAEYRVLYADEVDGLRIVLMFRPVGTRSALAWLTGPTGAPPADLDVSLSDDGGPSARTAVAVSLPDPAGRGTRLVVLTEDGNTVRVYPGVDVDPATGAAGRSYLGVPATDGIASTLVERSSDAGVRLLVGPPGELRDDVWPTSPGASFLVGDVHAGTGPPSRSGAPTAASGAYASALSTVVAATGWAEEDLEVTVLGAGTLPAAAGGTLDVVSLAVVLPGGAVVTTTGTAAQTTAEDGSTVLSFGGGCGSTGYPAGTDIADLVVAATCVDVGDAYTRTVVVAAPPGVRVVLGFPSSDDTLVPELVDGFGWTTFLTREDPGTATAGTTTFPVAGAGRDVLQQ
jgi:hypothetical protein